MPNFYAKEILENGSYCMSKTEDWMLGPLFNLAGFCKSLDKYNYQKDTDGNPLISEC